MVVSPRLAVSLNHCGSHKYWLHDSRTEIELNVLSIGGDLALAAPPLHFHLTAAARRLAPPPAAVRFLRGWTCSDHVDEEVPFMTNLSALLVQTDEGGVIPVVDRIRRSTAAYL
ncbi:hypothetical protein F511_33303 [Dorcoceras hygrometricum]|uniref:Uncharacterized protein n=1 Tax=Dorcoceras hygrometricum TaxID=472368 RepID=A0A2Z7CFW4_9LAMI|nr:hypothetical protein F511_33303 [Dorcoceras hygrometricum]